MLKGKSCVRIQIIVTRFLGGPGLHDPCEKEVTDASKEMTDQEREELTATAQVGNISNNKIASRACFV